MQRWMIVFLSSLIFSAAIAGDALRPLRLKTGTQLRTALSQATGVSTEESNVALAFERAKYRLPVKGDLSELNKVTVLAMGTMGSVYCQSLIAKESAMSSDRRLVTRGIDFNARLDSVSEGQRREVISRLADVFWSRAATSYEFSQLLDAWALGGSELSAVPNGHQKLLGSICSVFPMSVDFILD